MNRCCRNAFLRPRTEARSRVNSQAVNTLYGRLFSTSQERGERTSASPKATPKTDKKKGTGLVNIVGDKLCGKTK
jgi:hypothetical protein